MPATAGVFPRPEDPQSTAIAADPQRFFAERLFYGVVSAIEQTFVERDRLSGRIAHSLSLTWLA